MKTKLLLALAFCLLITNVNVFATTWTINVGPSGSMTFDPSSLTVTLGDTIIWAWASGSHTTTSTTIPSGAATWDQPINSSSTTYSYVPAVTGDYSYECIPHASMGMLGSFTVVPCTVPSVPTIFGAPSVCAGIPDTIVVPNGPGYTFTWYRDGVAIPGADSNKYAVTDAPGVYTYKVVVSNSCGSDTTAAFSSTVYALPVPVINDTIKHDTVTFATTVLAGATYSWNFGDGTHDTGAHTTHIYANTHDTVTLTVTNSNGCIGTTQKIITIPRLGVNTLTAGNGISIFPNPAKDEAIVNYDIQAGAASMKMMDIVGNVVYTTSLTSQSRSVHVPLYNLPAGLYIVEINAGNARYIQKLIKQ